MLEAKKGGCAIKIYMQAATQVFELMGREDVLEGMAQRWLRRCEAIDNEVAVQRRVGAWYQRRAALTQTEHYYVNTWRGREIAAAEMVVKT